MSHLRPHIIPFCFITYVTRVNFHGTIDRYLYRQQQRREVKRSKLMAKFPAPRTHAPPPTTNATIVSKVKPALCSLVKCPHCYYNYQGLSPYSSQKNEQEWQRERNATDINTYEKFYASHNLLGKLLFIIISKSSAPICSVHYF